MIIIAYASLSLLAYIFQTNLIFFPTKLGHDYQFTLYNGAEEIFIETTDGETINALYFPGKRDDVILYFHGNAGDLSTWQQTAKDFTNWGFSFMVIDFRGYGKSTGNISEEGFYLDAEAALNFLLVEKQFQTSRIIVYGRSVGSGVTTYLASKQKLRG